MKREIDLAIYMSKCAELESRPLWRSQREGYKPPEDCDLCGREFQYYRWVYAFDNVYNRFYLCDKCRDFVRYLASHDSPQYDFLTLKESIKLQILTECDEWEHRHSNWSLINTGYFLCSLCLKNLRNSLRYPLYTHVDDDDMMKLCDHCHHKVQIIREARQELERFRHSLSSMFSKLRQVNSIRTRS